MNSEYVTSNTLMSADTEIPRSFLSYIIVAPIKMKLKKHLPDDLTRPGGEP